MTNSDPFVLISEHQDLVLSALNAYLYQLRSRTGKHDIYKELVAHVEHLHDELFFHHYGTRFERL